tara:strand:+ start:1163 stop:1348 length:186 start_codon:yes stop_codon:yes gene_type:complete
MNEIKLSLQENEINALLQLIDIAVKSEGLQVAEPAAIIASKIQDQRKEQLGPDAEDKNTEK